MDFALAPESRAAGYGLVSVPTIGSTSAEASARGRGGEPGPLWIVSDHQSAGRGRRGSHWATPPGNLAASLLLTLDAPPAIVATLGFVAGLALGRALEGCCPGGSASFEARLCRAPQDEERESFDSPHAEVPRSGLEARTPFVLKWPNDVLVDGAKLAGILLESEVVGGRRFVVVGMGVNVAHAPTDLPYPATSLAALGSSTDAASVFAALSREWVALERVWDRGRGFAEIRRLWLARAAGLGGVVAVRSREGVRRGIFETIDDGGQLVVRADDGQAHFVSAGEVHFGGAASASAGQGA